MCFLYANLIKHSEANEIYAAIDRLSNQEIGNHWSWINNDCHPSHTNDLSNHNHDQSRNQNHRRHHRLLKKMKLDSQSKKI